MVVKNLRINKADGKMVIWTKPATGDQMIPYDDPDNNMQAVDFSSTWDYYQPAAGFPLDKAITHVASAPDTGTLIGDDPSVTGQFGVISYVRIDSTDYKLADHSLEYEPDFAVSVNGVEYPAGCPIQINGNGSRRSISFWVDTASIWVRDSSRPGPSGLPAITVTYHVAVFETLNTSGQPLFQAKLTGLTPRVTMGYGRIDTNKPKPLREAASGEATYALPAGETMDIDNGRVRYALPDGSVFDIGNSFGLAAYNGSFLGSPSKKVTV